MKIVFVQPHTGFRSHAWEASGIGFISAFLKENIGNLNIQFYSGFYDTDETIIEACQDADIIGFGCSSPQFKHGMELASKVKKPYNIVAVGGFHPTCLPDKVLLNPSVDAIIQGEGEEAFFQLVKDYDLKGRVLRSYKKGYISNLDVLPFPDREIIKNERNILQAYSDEGIRITSILSSRGCSFLCSFCSAYAMMGRKVRYRSATNVLDEFEKVAKDWKIDLMKFADDTFTINKKRVIEFCKLKLERGIKTPFGCNAHVNTIDEELLSWMVSAGCKELWFGVESGSSRILKEMKKASSIKKIKKAFKLTREYGVIRRGYFLLGTPSETLEDIKMTEELCDEIDPDIVGFTILTPYPINDYFDYMTMKDWDWSEVDHYHSRWAKTPTISNKEYQEIQARLIKKYEDKMAFRLRKENL